jgi:hypothetical protein
VVNLDWDGSLVEIEYVITNISPKNMNAQPCIGRLPGSVTALLLLAVAAFAEVPVVTNFPSTTAIAQSDAAPPPPAWRVPYGVQEILTLTRAQIGETLVMNYISNSGTIYNLQAMDIVHLRDQGVSERIIGVMLEQKARVVAEAKVEAPAVPAVPTAVTPVYAAPVLQPAVMVVSVPPPEPQSMLHIIPYRSAAYAGYTSYRPYQLRPYFNYSPAYYGGWCGGGSTVITLHGGFGGHSPSRRGWR